MTNQEAAKMKYGDKVIVQPPYMPPTPYWFKAMDPQDPNTAILSTDPNMKYNIGCSLNWVSRD